VSSGNEVKIKVVTDDRDAGLGKAKQESAELTKQVVKDAAAMKAASDRLDAARRREADTAGTLRVAQTKYNEVVESGTASASKLTAAEERLAKAQRDSAAAAAKASAAAETLAAARDKAAANAKDTNTTTVEHTKLDIDVGGGLKNITSGLVGEAKSAGILAGAALGGGIAAGLTAVGAAGMFVGIAAAAQSSTPAVREAYSTLWGQIKAGAQDASASLAGDFVSSAESLGRTFNSIKPEIVDAMAAGKPVIADLTDGVDRLAKTAMPGLVVASRSAAQASGGVADAMESSGRAVSNFFTEASHGAPAAGEAFSSFGRIVERMGSFAGRILAELANNSSSVFPALEGAVDSTASAVENLAHTALPALASGAALSLTGLGLLLNLANTIVTALGPMAGTISNVATSLKLVDMVTFGGVERSWKTFKDSLSEAEGLGGKVKAGLSGIVGGLGPMGILAGVGALALDSLSKAQQEAAQAEAEHRDRIRSLSDALRESNGVVTDSIRMMAAKKLQDMQVADSGRTVMQVARDAGVDMATLTDAYLGNASAQREVTDAMNGYIAALNDAGQADDPNAGPNATAEAIANLRDMFPGLIGEFGDAKRRQEDLNDAMHGGANSADAQRKALQDLQTQIDTMVDKDLAYRNAVDATAEAEAAAGEARKKHGQNSGEYADAVRGVEAAEIAQARAARDLAVANSTANSDVGKAADGQKAYAHEVLAMAEAAGNAAPASLRQMVSGLSDTDLAAMHATRSIDGAGNAVYTLPNGKTMMVSAEDDATWRTQRIAQQLASLPTLKVITVEERHIITQNLGNVPSGWQSAGRKAAGGPASSVHQAAAGGARTGLIEVNERGIESAFMPDRTLVTMPTGSSVNPAAGSAGLSPYGGWGGPIRVEVSMAAGAGDELGRAVLNYLRVKVQSNGGGPDGAQRLLGAAA
jgi:hypothetical protein